MLNTCFFFYWKEEKKSPKILFWFSNLIVLINFYQFYVQIYIIPKSINIFYFVPKLNSFCIHDGDENINNNWYYKKKTLRILQQINGLQLCKFSYYKQTCVTLFHIHQISWNKHNCLISNHFIIKKITKERQGPNKKLIMKLNRYF
jgi:hypothetical protein